MPSKLPKVNFVLSEEELAMVQQYKDENGIRSLSKAFVELVAKGLDKENRRIAEQEAAQNERQSAKIGGLSDVEAALFTEFRAIPDTQKELAASLCLAVIRELLKHYKVELETEASALPGSDRQ